ncbi:DUF1501 domain-containing protein [Zavarzinella formosa]|uniref:DUF1501 domain-containing protein n=1 Tax=Zavarzinella formosa TaxID=360055 RepID=UPI00035C15EE|nr:DUF1501 domain-containing protein [Zavarzinella formosa]
MSVHWTCHAIEFLKGNAMPISRRDFLQTAAGSAIGLAVSPVLANPLPQTKNCIFIVLTGGPGQLDTWDPKPEAPAEIRSPFAAIPTRIPGVRFTELFPHMAANAHRFQVVRSVHHTAAPIHETGLQLLQTGQLSGPDESIPHLLTGGKLLPGPIGFTGVNLDRGQTGLTPASVDVEQDRSRETFGPSSFGDDCLRACRLIERGTRNVVVNMFTEVYDRVSWDCHAAGGSLATSLDDYRAIGPMFDRAYVALLTELEQRGLLQDTLVVAAGEFGRTPKRNPLGGRDHWAGVWSVLLAGAGVPGGTVVGSSDRLGSEPASEPVKLEMLNAMIREKIGQTSSTK